MVMLSKECNNNLDEIISYITSTSEYLKCIELKERMRDNKKINTLVEEIKKLQKEFIRNEDNTVKNILDEKEKELNSIPIYNEYNNNLIAVNQMINLVKDELNDYFYQKLNKDIEK